MIVVYLATYKVQPSMAQSSPSSRVSFCKTPLLHCFGARKDLTNSSSVSRKTLSSKMKVLYMRVFDKTLRKLALAQLEAATG